MAERVPRLGVVVLNWNGRAHLGPCLDALAASDHPDFFVVVVDNASHDGSVDFVRESHPEVEVLALAENLRFAGGNNVGAARAVERGAEVLLILNNDTVVAPTCLSKLAAAFDDPAVDVAGPRIVFADEPERIWYGGGRIDLRRGHIAHRAIRRRVDEGADPAGATDWVSGCALAVRAPLWTSLGGLDESFYIYSEDVDFCLRARAAGARIVYEPAAVLAHAVSASVGGRVSAFKAYHRTRARRQLFARHGRGPLWPVGALVQDLAWGGWALLRGSPAALVAVLQAWFESPSSAPKHPVDELPLASETRRTP